MSNRKALVLLTFAICGLLVLAAFVSRQSSDDNVPVPQQNALGQVAEAAGYDVNGMPAYNTDLRRWTINVKVPGCKATVNLGGDPGPESQSPASFAVLAIAGTSLPQSLPELKATDLKQQPGRTQQLGCV